MIEVVPLRASDRASWELLARGYKEFYRTPTTLAEFDAAWQRLMHGTEVHGLGARLDGRLVGIAHYLFHATVWAERACYLQDLFTHPEARGKGVARALIAAVADKARDGGAARYYWLTQDHNKTARALYDQVAKHNGFIRYDHPLPA
jgi:GNAT superfamily N-acetyltransferase